MLVLLHSYAVLLCLFSGTLAPQVFPPEACRQLSAVAVGLLTAKVQVTFPTPKKGERSLPSTYRKPSLVESTQARHRGIRS